MADFDRTSRQRRLEELGSARVQPKGPSHAFTLRRLNQSVESAVLVSALAEQFAITVAGSEQVHLVVQESDPIAARLRIVTALDEIDPEWSEHLGMPSTVSAR